MTLPYLAGSIIINGTSRLPLSDVSRGFSHQSNWKETARDNIGSWTSSQNTYFPHPGESLAFRHDRPSWLCIIYSRKRLFRVRFAKLLLLKMNNVRFCQVQTLKVRERKGFSINYNFTTLYLNLNFVYLKKYLNNILC